MSVEFVYLDYDLIKNYYDSFDKNPTINPTGITHNLYFSRIDELLRVLNKRLIIFYTKRMNISFIKSAIFVRNKNEISNFVNPNNKTAIIASDTLLSEDFDKVDIFIVNQEFSLDRALLTAFGCCSLLKLKNTNSKTEYLKDKSKIDAKSYNKRIYQYMSDALKNIQPKNKLQVFDIGCGNLSMLDIIISCVESAGFDNLIYRGFDSDIDLLQYDQTILFEKGYVKYEKKYIRNRNNLSVTVYIQKLDVHLLPELIEKNVYEKCDLLVASSFADLMQPKHFSGLLRRVCNKLVYLPITFSGKTHLQYSLNNLNIPDSEFITTAYHNYLRTNEQQYIDVNLLIQSLSDIGFNVKYDDSYWNIEVDDEIHKWIVDFISCGTAVELLKDDYDIASWFEIMSKERIVIENIDIFAYV